MRDNMGLYRGKRTDNGEWATGYFVKINGINYIIQGAFNATLRENTADRIPVSSETVGQYTGLLDKNGKRIFEGDVCDDGGNTYLVRYEDGAFVFASTKTSTTWGGAFDCYSSLSVVIGNIHDNPIGAV